MLRYLVIVESPAKAKTISRYLGDSYEVKASVGHVRDLPPDELGVDKEANFAPTYRILKGKKEIVAEIKRAAHNCDRAILATDPDREGEAIAWHIIEAADLHDYERVTFDQVTKKAVQEAIRNPRSLDQSLIEAQQARRVIDRLVGYQISPLISKTMRKRLSAGRVQSVALKLIVDREREIAAFVPVEYWSIDAELATQEKPATTLCASLHKIKGKDPHLPDQETVEGILAILEEAIWRVARVKEGRRRRKPSPPFVTSTLQSRASGQLHFSPRQTMRLAQQLYEGIQMEEEMEGLITYMRTDSPHVAPEAQAEARQLITEHWGEKYLPAKAPIYRGKSAHAQEAHEAIRPTSVQRTPERVKPFLNRRQHRLYRLIWQRFVASQMKPALYKTLRVDIEADQDYSFRANARRLLFPGYLVVYEDTQQESNDDTKILTDLHVDQMLDLLELLPEQHFTKPKPRFSESTLIKELESNGVGRPSTYAAIVSTIQERGYVEEQSGRLHPTDLGIVVCDALVDTFPDIMDVRYTAEMEETLDQIARGDMDYVTMLSSFYGEFHEELEKAQEDMPDAVSRALKSDIPEDVLKRKCPQCGRPLAVRLSAAGRFLGCTGYPQCRYTLDLSDPQEPEESEEQYAEGKFCEKCGGRMKIITHGNLRFLGCENYPKCKHTRPILSDQILELAQETACPDCGLQPMEPRKGRYGEYLYCPQCEKNYSLRKLGIPASALAETVDRPCPECGSQPIERRIGRWGPYYHCPKCGNNVSEDKMPADHKN